MGADILCQLCTWVDATSGVHPDLKSHIGGGMSFGYGLVHRKSRKQKLNAKISTKAEVVGVSNCLS